MRSGCLALILLGAMSLPALGGAWDNPDGSAPAFTWSNGTNSAAMAGFGSPVVAGNTFIFFPGKLSTDHASFDITMSPGFMLTGVRAESENIVGQLSVIARNITASLPSRLASAAAPGAGSLTVTVPQLRPTYDRAHIEFDATVITAGDVGSAFMIEILVRGPDEFIRPAMQPGGSPAASTPEPAMLAILPLCLLLRRFGRHS